MAHGLSAVVVPFSRFVDCRRRLGRLVTANAVASTVNVSRTIATLYCSLVAPRMAAVEVAEMVMLFAALTPNTLNTPMK